jgi:DNA-binding NtrC family response regulator
MAVGRRPHVLVVDDDASVLDTTAALLSDDYEVACARDGREALSLFQPLQFDVVCSDYGMPGMNGADLLRHVAASCDQTGCVLVTGYGEYSRTFDRESEPDRFYVVLKPYAPPQLLDVVGRAAQRAASRRRVVAASSEAKRVAASVLGTQASPPLSLPNAPPKKT